MIGMLRITTFELPKPGPGIVSAAKVSVPFASESLGEYSAIYLACRLRLFASWTDVRNSQVIYLTATPAQMHPRFLQEHIYVREENCIWVEVTISRKISDWGLVRVGSCWPEAFNA